MIGETIIRLNSITNTSNFVAKCIDQGEYEWGTAILADFQTNGRGQRDALWQSESGKNLIFSFGAQLIDFDPRAYFKVTQSISVALHHFLKSRLANEVYIKWPNDLICDSKKLAGILVECKGGQNPYVICGIGVNLNQTEFEGLPKAASIRTMTGIEYDLEAELHDVLIHLNAEWLKLSSGDFRSLRSDYNQRLYGYNSRVTFQEGSQSHEGILVDVSEEGQLILQKDGHTQEYRPKSIKLIY